MAFHSGKLGKERKKNRHREEMARNVLNFVLREEIRPGGELCCERQAVLHADLRKVKRKEKRRGRAGEGKKVAIA